MQTIFSVVTHPSLGTFLSSMMQATALKFQYKEARLISHMSPQTRDSYESMCMYSALDYLYDGYQMPLSFLNAYWPDAGPHIHGRFDPANGGLLLAKANFFFMPSMHVNSDHVADKALLSIPNKIEKDAERILIEKGLKRDRWFACLHVREDDYKNNANLSSRSIRDISPFDQAINYIIEEQGGQVVRLGDPTCQPLKARPNLIDLTTDEHNLILQSFAISRARYVLGTDSGPNVLARAFNTPYGYTNLLSFYPKLHTFHFPKHHIIATKKVILENGEELSGYNLMMSKYCHQSYWDGKPEKIKENCLEDVKLICKKLFMETQHTTDPWYIRPLATHDVNGLSENEAPNLQPSKWPLRILNEINDG